MSEIFQVEMLPASEGDCVVVTYGEPGDLRRIMVDGGRTSTYRYIKDRYSSLPRSDRVFELLVVSHVDRDHIEGALALLEDPDPPLYFKDVWFNSYEHLLDQAFESFGAQQGERLTATLRTRPETWNAAFGGRSVELRPERNVITLEGGLQLTLLSPDRAKLETLAPTWERECQKSDLIPGAGAERPSAPEGMEVFGQIDVERLAAQPFVPDRAEANGTSIALLASYGQRRVILSADSHTDLLLSSLQPLAALEGGRLKVDALKLPHHGSQHNLPVQLLEVLSCPRFLVSTNGNYFRHPDAVALARVITHGGNRAVLVFNYRSEETLLWSNRSWQKRYDYQSIYPDPSEDGRSVVDLGS